MNPQIAFRRHVNVLFALLSCTVAIQLLISAILVEVDRLIGMGVPISEYMRDFVLPQFLYPMLNLLLAWLGFYALRIPAARTMKISAVKGSDLFLWAGFFLGAVSVGNVVVGRLILWLEQLGFSSPSVFSQHNPETVGEAVLFFVVAVILPAFSEEVLFRAMTAGGIREFHPGAAVVLSALGFGMMHGNIQQIPFALILGLVLGMVYVKTGNFLYPVLLHFINNTWACAITFLGIFVSEEVAGVVQGICLLLFFVIGLTSLVFLIRRRAFSFQGEEPLLTGAQARTATLKSVGFWAFMGLYLLLTVLLLFAKK